jgi:putative sigma-54 modulation protein
MRIEIKGRNVAVGDELRERIEKRFQKVAKQVSELALMELELSEEKNPSIKESQVAEATLHLKGVTLRAREASDNMVSAVNEVADELARQVKRHRDKRRRRREQRAGGRGRLAEPGEHLRDHQHAGRAALDHSHQATQASMSRSPCALATETRWRPSTT